MQKSIMDRKLVSGHTHRGDYIGRSQHRLEDRKFLTGQGRYVDDIALPGQLHGVVLRSPHGHALIDALAPLGIAHIDMPATPERIRAVGGNRSD